MFKGSTSFPTGKEVAPTADDLPQATKRKTLDIVFAVFTQLAFQLFPAGWAQG